MRGGSFVHWEAPGHKAQNSADHFQHQSTNKETSAESSE
jgi:hypothetical protein